MGNGSDVAIGGIGGDVIYGDDGMDILVGDNAAMTFYTVPNSTGGLLRGAPRTISSMSCEDGGKDFIYGGPGAVNYM